MTKTKKEMSKNSRKSPRLSSNDKKIAKKNMKTIKKGADPKSSKKSVEKKSPKESIQEWVQCESCYKWRKIPAGVSKLSVKKKFYCDFFKGNTCETTEESWRRHYTTIAKD